MGYGGHYLAIRGMLILGGALNTTGCFPLKASWMYIMRSCINSRSRFTHTCEKNIHSVA